MTNKSKKVRTFLCGIVSFLLSFFTCLFAMCLVFQFTVLNSSFVIGIEKRSDYAESLQSELKEQFVSYGNAGNVDESFFEDVFSNVITVDRIESDTKSVIEDFYNGTVRDAVDTSDIESQLEEMLINYAGEKGFVINNVLKENISDMVTQFGELYNSYVSLFSNSYFKTAGSMLSRYTRYAGYIAVIAVTLALISALILRMSYKKRKNVYRYCIYSSAGTALMLAVGPLIALIANIGGRINIATKSLYILASGFINGTLKVFLLASLIFAVLTALLSILRNYFVKKNI